MGLTHKNFNVIVWKNKVHKQFEQQKIFNLKFQNTCLNMLFFFTLLHFVYGIILQ